MTMLPCSTKLCGECHATIQHGHSPRYRKAVEALRHIGDGTCAGPLAASYARRTLKEIGEADE
jgi:hypothetical protein